MDIEINIWAKYHLCNQRTKNYGDEELGKNENNEDTEE